jgi:hypothetical protein
LLVLLFIVLPLHADLFEDELVWEDHFSDNEELTDSSQATTPGGITITLDTEVYSDGQGSFDPHISNDDDYIRVEHEEFGAHEGFAELGFDNSSYDTDDFLRLRIDFSEPVRDLQFSLLDVDHGTSSGGWDDGIEVLYNGDDNVRDVPDVYSFPDGSNRSVLEDNESYFRGFEGWDYRTAGSSEIRGNIDFDFSDTWVSSVEIKYLSTDDNIFGGPVSQRIGVSDMSYLASEPSLSVLAVVAGLLFFLQRPVRQRHRP